MKLDLSLFKHLKMEFLTVFGSRLYGTQNQNSDVDYKGLYTPEKSVLFLGESLKDFQSRTDSKEKNDKTDVDFSIYPIQKFFRLIKSSDTNAISILMSRKSHTGNVLFMSDWFADIDHTKLISKDLSGMLGFVRSQAVKYSRKGDRVAILDYLLEYLSKQNQTDSLYLHHENIIQATYNNDVEEFVDGEGIRYLSVFGKKFVLSQSIKYHLPQIKSLREKYGKRAELANNAHKVDLKSIYHAFRVLKEIEMLHLYGEFSYPLENTYFLLDIRNDLFTKEYLFDKLSYELNRVSTLESNSVLPETIDSKYINEQILSRYS